MNNHLLLELVLLIDKIILMRLTVSKITRFINHLRKFQKLIHSFNESKRKIM